MHTFKLPDLMLGADGKLTIDDPKRLGMTLNAYLAFPGDELLRTEFLAAFEAHRNAVSRPTIDWTERFLLDTFVEQQEFSESAVKYAAENMRNKLLEIFFSQGGGFAPAAGAALSRDALFELGKAGRRRAAIAGAVLLYTHVLNRFHNDELRGGSSVGKAQDLLIMWEEEQGKRLSKTVVANAWSSHRSVAHVAAADILKPMSRMNWWSHTEYAEQSQRASMLDFLGLTESLRIFGTSFRPERSPHPCLDPGTTLRYEFNVPPLDHTPHLRAIYKELLDRLILERWAS